MLLTQPVLVDVVINSIGFLQITKHCSFFQKSLINVRFSNRQIELVTAKSGALLTIECSFLYKLLHRLFKNLFFILHLQELLIGKYIIETILLYVGFRYFSLYIRLH